MMIYTVGFTNKPARAFFQMLRDSSARSLVDVRLNNIPPLAGFAQGDDLAYFLNTICEMEYVHEPLLAPNNDMLDDYMNHGASWGSYERRFRNLMRERRVEKMVSQALVDNSVLLCSEEKPARCHRRLVAEYLKEHWGDVQIRHLG